MLRIGLIGCGKWSRIVANEINKHKNFELSSVVCKDEINFAKNIIKLKDINESLNKKINDCLYVAHSPLVNVKVAKLASNIKMPLIIEKPITNNYNDALEIKELVNKEKSIIIPNSSHLFSETYEKIKSFINNNYKNIKRITIIEGDKGPFREKIHPIWDWGFHPLSLVIHLFKDKELSNFRVFELRKNNKFGKGLVSQFNFKINSNIDAKIITGNLFKRKKRILKIILKNNEILTNNMIDHKLYFKNEEIYKNQRSPLCCILDNFYNDIKFQNIKLSNQLIDTSCKVTKILDNFYAS